MDLIILNRHDLSYKDHAFINDEMYINCDIYLLQKSTFIVSKQNFNAIIGDLILIKNETSFIYLGIVDSIVKDKNNYSSIEAYEFKALFNIDILATSLNGDIATYLTNIFTTNFISSDDSMQRLPYLEIRSSINISGELLFDENTIINLNDLLEKLSKSYDVGFISYPLIENGIIFKIIMEFVLSTKEIKLKYDSGLIRNLSIKLSENQTLNKIVFIPKSSNVTYQEKISYYLLKDNEITTVESSENRYDVVLSKIIFYEDSEYVSLSSIAYSNLKSTIFSHKISFEMAIDNKVIKPLFDFKLGDIIEFIIDNITYKTIFSGYQLNVKTGIIQITLGEVRTKLTDKLKKLEKENSSKNSSQSNVASHKHNEYFSGYVLGNNLYLTKN
jgi:hypothetical protein